ncbi:MAG TPA: asparagine synthase (glutamine-hydrolyzing) [Pyrinomonadaceae bacterium]|nr:asparagine synthase (glutamine-hydrolyzing) [Pyrinomonadaceae bacterium]
MCGITGYIDLENDGRVEKRVLVDMADSLVHRGPDDCGYFVERQVGLGFRRLSIIDKQGGNQPFYSEDGSIVSICNGEIFNYQELRESLIKKGHLFRTRCDVEVLPHLYEEYGDDFLQMLNGQFAFALYDRRNRRLLLARDHFGINPLYYTVTDNLFIFASEIKAILRHPSVHAEVNLTGLDQVLSFPGLVSPQTMFKNILSLKSGHLAVVQKAQVRVHEYWDLDYPKLNELPEARPESYYIDRLRELFTQSVGYRLQADVPVGFYLSGGLDSSMIAGMISRLSAEQRHSFSITFSEREISEDKYQRLVAEHVGSEHHDIHFGWSEIAERLRDMIYHCETPVKETYNTCSMALSAAARQSGVPVVLTGEGADELFAGYVGYRFDQFGLRRTEKFGLEQALEEELREAIFGDRNLFYETDHTALREIKNALYAPDVVAELDTFDCLNHSLVNKERLRGRHPIHQRSYLDFKLRLSDHLIADHGDRMALANSVEARYPFLDIDLIEFSREVPPELKLNQFTEKYVLRKVADGLVPEPILNREKYGFHAPGSPSLLRRNLEWVNDLLSYDRIRRQGFFNADTVERLKRQYLREDFQLNLPFESDLLMIVLTFGIFLDFFTIKRLAQTSGN